MSNGFKILVVEDEALTALELQKKLISWGYDVVDTVSSGEDAVKKALKLKPDLILMDILLKGNMTGIDAARDIKNQIEIPIIYLTAYCNIETFEGAKITQPYAYLIKPFQENELKFAIEMAFYGHQSQLKLKESEARYRILAENAQDMIFIINKDLLVDYVNESSLKYLKLPKEQVIGKKVHSIFPKNTFKEQKKSLKEIFRTGNSFRSENLFNFPDYELWLDTRLEPLKDDKGEVYAIMGISRDITDKIQNDFQEGNDLNQYIIENIAHPMFYKDRSGVYRGCNRAFEEFLGLSKEDIIGKKVHDVAPKPLADKYLEKDQELFENPGVQCYDFKVQHADGSVRDILFNKTTFLGSTGNVAGIIGLMVDLTDQKNMETEMNKSLEEKESLLRDIHNSVENNLKMVSSLLCLQSTYISDEDIRSMFQENETRVRALALIHEKMYHSDDLASIDFGDYLKSLMEILIDFYDTEGDNVDYEVNSEEIFLGIDTAIPLGLIANELVSNSFKHAFSKFTGGRVSVQLKGGKHLIMDVKDNGVGLPSDFDLEKSGDLGFKIVKSLVDEINAEMEVNNELGAHFIIMIPKNSLRVYNK